MAVGADEVAVAQVEQARAQSAAAAGTILVTQRVYDRTPALGWNDTGRDHVLKGIVAPVRLYSASDRLPSRQD